MLRLQEGLSFIDFSAQETAKHGGALELSRGENLIYVNKIDEGTGTAERQRMDFVTERMGEATKVKLEDLDSHR